MLACLFDAKIDVTDILCDNQICIKMTENYVFLDKSKHVDSKYHFLRDMLQKGAIKLKYVPTKEQVADVLNKPLASIKFEYFRDSLGVVRKDLSRKRE